MQRFLDLGYNIKNHWNIDSYFVEVQPNSVGKKVKGNDLTSLTDGVGR
jgi:hypothetical protein